MISKNPRGQGDYFQDYHSPRNFFDFHIWLRFFSMVMIWVGSRELNPWWNSLRFVNVAIDTLPCFIFNSLPRNRLHAVKWNTQRHDLNSWSFQMAVGNEMIEWSNDFGFCCVSRWILRCTFRVKVDDKASASTSLPRSQTTYNRVFCL